MKKRFLYMVVFLGCTAMVFAYPADSTWNNVLMGNTDGQVKILYGTNLAVGASATGFGIVTAVGVQPDGDVVIANASGDIWIYNTQLTTVKASRNVNSGTNPLSGGVNKLAIRADGNLVVGCSGLNSGILDGNDLHTLFYNDEGYVKAAGVQTDNDSVMAVSYVSFIKLRDADTFSVEALTIPDTAPSQVNDLVVNPANDKILVVGNLENDQALWQYEQYNGYGSTLVTYRSTTRGLSWKAIDLQSDQSAALISNGTYPWVHLLNAADTGLFGDGKAARQFGIPMTLTDVAVLGNDKVAISTAEGTVMVLDAVTLTDNISGTGFGNVTAIVPAPPLSAPSPVTVQGTVALGDYVGLNGSGDLSDVLARIELRPGGGPVRTEKVILSPTGHFAISEVAAGTYDIAIKTYGHLQTVRSAVDCTVDVNLGTVALVNGDCDGNNQVNSTDLAIVLSNLDQIGN